MNSLKRILPSLAFFMICLLGAAQPVAAWNPFSTTCPQRSAGLSSAICSSKFRGNPVITAIDTATNIIAFVAGVAAVIVIIVGGLRYITANGDSSSISSAKDTIVNALIGLALIVVARTLIVFLVSKL